MGCKILQKEIKTKASQWHGDVKDLIYNTDIGINKYEVDKEDAENTKHTSAVAENAPE